MKNNIFTLTFLILGTVIGAGFASGKEIVIFFTRFGPYSFLLILLSGIVFYVSFRLYLKAGHVIHPNNFTDVTNNIIKNKTSNFYNFIIFISFILVTSGMFAAVREVSFNFSNAWFQNTIMIVTIFACYFVCKGGIKNLNKINAYIMPIVIVLILVLCTLTNVLVKREVLTIETNTLQTIFSIGSCLIYVGLNIILAGCVLIQIGNNYTIKEINSASLFASVLITLILLFINGTILYSDYNILTSSLPMLNLSYKINNFWGILTILIIWICIFTALISSIYVIAKFLNVYIKNFKYCNIISIIITFGISLLGFSNIVTFVYPVIGTIGVFYTIRLCIFNNNHKQTMYHNRNFKSSYKLKYKGKID